MSIDDTLTNRYFLVVDDEVFVRNLVARFLRQAGAADVVEAANGREALAALASYEMAFDAVISDIEMGPINGLELLKAIRTGADGLRRNTAVVMLTAHGDADLVCEALALDADAFVLKPIGRDELAERVLRVVERPVAIQPVTAYGAVPVRSSAAPEIPAAPAAPPPPPLAHPQPVPRAAHAPAHPPAPRAAAAAAAALPAGAKKLRLSMVPANSMLAADVLGADGRPLVRAPALLTRALLARLDDLRRIHTGVRELVVFEPSS